MMLKKGQQIELRISDIAFGGKGLARINGLVVFVDQTIPGDLVVANIVKKKKQYAEARIESLIEPSPFRIDAPCVYSGFCGGCKWQFLDYGTQLDYKRRHVVETLAHIGRIQAVPVHPVIPAERIFGYRNKMEFSCSDRRWLLPAEMNREGIDKGFALGLHVPGTFNKVIDIQKCMLQPEQGNAILDDIRTFIRKTDAPVYDLRSHKGFWRFVMLRHSVAFDQWMINIITAAEDRSIVQPLAEQLLSKYPEIVSVVNNVTSRKAGVAIGEYEILLAGQPWIRDKIGRFDFEISANSFFQTNTAGAKRLYDIVKQYAALQGNETVIDLYSGTGTIAICLAADAQEVIGLEIVESAVADAEKNCRLNRIFNCRFVQGDIRTSLAQVRADPDVLIIDPPRAGMHPEIVRQVIEMKPKNMVYISCNPATMARDLGMLREDYTIREVQPVDMFPHTYHIESVARLEKRES